MNDTPYGHAAARTRPARILTYLSKHFAVFSSVAAILGGLSATIFLYAYLSIFDWRLIWFVEYSDIVKVGLIAMAVISGFSFIVYAIAHDACGWFTDKSKRRAMWFPVAILTIGF